MMKKKSFHFKIKMIKHFFQINNRNYKYKKKNKKMKNKNKKIMTTMKRIIKLKMMQQLEKINKT